MRLSDLQNKNIVNVIDGKNIGNIIDASVNEEGKVEYFIIEESKSFFSLNKDNDKKILWNDITKIGEDVILVNIGMKWIKEILFFTLL